jgi:ankyrin repeat protein
MVDASEAIIARSKPTGYSPPCILTLLSLLNQNHRNRVPSSIRDDAHRLIHILLEAMNPKDIDKHPQNNDTMLTIAIRNKVSMDILHALVERGADVNRKGPRPYGFTPLMHANTPEQITFLLDNGANIDAVNNAGDTALMIAVRDGRLSLARLLLDRGASIDLQNNKGETALIIASTFEEYDDEDDEVEDVNRISLARLLLERGAEYNLTNKSGRSAWNYAEEQKDGLDNLLSEYQTRNQARNAVRNHSGFPTNVSKIVGNYLGGRRRRSKTRRGRSKTRRGHRRSKTCHRRRRH